MPYTTTTLLLAISYPCLIKRKTVRRIFLGADRLCEARHLVGWQKPARQGRKRYEHLLNCRGLFRMVTRWRGLQNWHSRMALALLQLQTRSSGIAAAKSRDNARQRLFLKCHVHANATNRMECEMTSTSLDDLIRDSEACKIIGCSKSSFWRRVAAFDGQHLGQVNFSR